MGDGTDETLAFICGLDGRAELVLPLFVVGYSDSVGIKDICVNIEVSADLLFQRYPLVQGHQIRQYHILISGDSNLSVLTGLLSMILETKVTFIAQQLNRMQVSICSRNQQRSDPAELLPQMQQTGFGGWVLPELTKDSRQKPVEITIRLTYVNENDSAQMLIKHPAYSNIEKEQPAEGYARGDYECIYAIE